MRSKLTAEDIVNTYENAGRVLEVTAYNGDYKAGNKEVNKLIKIFKMFEKNIELAVKILPGLLNSKSICTRDWVALHCLSLNIFVEEAIKVLEIDVNDERLVHAENANMLLDSYRQLGYAKVYPDQSFPWFEGDTNKKYDLSKHVFVTDLRKNRINGKPSNINGE